MIYVPRRYRIASHVGGVRKRLARMIVAALKAEGVEARCDPERLRPAQGYWRKIEQDVLSWEGSCETFNPETGEWSNRLLGSWDRMSSCVKGLTISKDGLGFEVHAVHELAPEKRFGIRPRNIS